MKHSGRRETALIFIPLAFILTLIFSDLFSAILLIVIIWVPCDAFVLKRKYELRKELKTEYPLESDIETYKYEIELLSWWREYPKLLNYIFWSK